MSAMDTETQNMMRLRDEARLAGSLVRFETYGVLVIVHSKYETADEKKKRELLTQLPLDSAKGVSSADTL